MVRNVDKTSEYVNILRQTDIFYDLTEPQLRMVAALCSEITSKAGKIIFAENSAGDELYVIVKGEVDILLNPALIQSTITEQPSRPLTIVTLRRGQIFGEIALVDQGLRSASARCTSKRARLLVIPSDRLTKLCDNYPDLGYHLMRNMAAELAFKIRGTDLLIREQLLWRPRSE